MRDLPPVVPAGCAGRRLATGPHQARVSGHPPAEDTGELAQPEPELCHQLAARPARDAGAAAAGAAPIAGAVEPTTLGVRERPVRPARRREMLRR